MIFQHARFQIWNANQHPYRHNTDEFLYSNPSLPGVTNVPAALDYLTAVLYPQAQAAVANQAALPLVGNTLNDMRVVTDDGDGKAAAYRWEQREGEVAASWHKIYDLDWGTDSILQGYMLKTQDVYASKRGYDDLDASGVAVVGTLAGQSIYGGASAGTNLTLFANSGDGVGAATGYVQFGDNARPTADSSFALGTNTERWLKIWTDELTSGTLTLAGGSITDSSGAISFDNENLTTTGSVTGASLKSGTLTISDGSISDSDGAISLGTTTLTTSTSLTAGTTTISSGLTDSSGRLKITGAHTTTASGKYLGIGIGDADPVDPFELRGGATVILDADNNFYVDGASNPRTITLGVMRFEHLPAVTGTRAINIDIEPSVYDDTRGMVIKQNLPNITASVHNQNLNLDADITGAQNVHLDFLRVSKVGDKHSSVSLHALDVAEDIVPVMQHTGTAIAVTEAFSYSGGVYTDITAALGDTGTDVQLFAVNNDYLYLGHSAKFTSVLVELATAASGSGIRPVFEYWSGAAWTALSCVDNTSGFRENGAISFSTPSGWATTTVNGSSRYWIRIQRTRNSLATPPTEDRIRLLIAADYYWNANGDIYVNSVSGGNLTLTGNTLSSSDTNGNVNLDPNGTGAVVSYATTKPSADNSLDLGTTADRWKTLYLGTSIGNGTNVITMSDLLSLRSVTYRDSGRTQPAQAGDALFYDGSQWLASAPDSEIAHSGLSGLTTGDSGHTQFVMLTGRAGGQTIQGGTAASENLTLESTAHASKGLIYAKDSILAYADAAYSAGWSGVDLGSASKRFRNLYTAGEAIGLRLENVGALPGASTQNVGRVVCYTPDIDLYIDTGTAFKRLNYNRYEEDTVWNGSDTTKTVTVSDVDARKAIWQLKDNTNDYETVYCSIKATASTTVVITVGTALPAGSYRLVGLE